MAAPAVINISKSRASDIQFAEPRRNKTTGAVSIGLKYNNQNVQFRVPRLGFPGGLMVKQNTNKDGSVSTSYVLKGSLPGGDPYGRELSDDPSDTAKAYNFLLEFQKHLIKAAVENSVKWFGKKRSEDSIQDSLNRFLSLSVDKTDNGWEPNGKYPPSLQMKLPVYDDKIAMEVIDSEDNDVPLSLDNLTTVFGKGTSATLILQAQVYISGQGFGVTWKPSYVQIYRRQKYTARDFFKRDVDDAEEADEEETPVVGGARAAFAAEDEEEKPKLEEDEGEEEVEIEAAPAPAPVQVAVEAPKKATRRKVA